MRFDLPFGFAELDKWEQRNPGLVGTDKQDFGDDERLHRAVYSMWVDEDGLEGEAFDRHDAIGGLPGAVQRQIHWPPLGLSVDRDQNYAGHQTLLARFQGYDVVVGMAVSSLSHELIADVNRPGVSWRFLVIHTPEPGNAAHCEIWVVESEYRKGRIPSRRRPDSYEHPKDLEVSLEIRERVAALCTVEYQL